MSDPDKQTLVVNFWIMLCLVVGIGVITIGVTIGRYGHPGHPAVPSHSRLVSGSTPLWATTDTIPATGTIVTCYVTNRGGIACLIDPALEGAQ